MNKKSSKNDIIRIRLSSPFMVRAACKYCSGGPLIYYYIRNSTNWFDPRKAIGQLAFLRNLARQITTAHIFSEPKDYNVISYFSLGVGYTQYRPKLHRTRGSSFTLDIVEFLTCDCMKTTWAFNQKSIQNRPEISNRKSRFNFPKKIDF